MVVDQRSVPILVFEDKYLGDGAELGKLVGFPMSRNEGGQNYVFDWHPVYNALGGGAELIRSLAQYQAAFDFLRNELSGEAIIFFDLEFQGDDGRTLPIDVTHVSDDLFAFMKCLDKTVNSPSHGLELFNPERLGLFLAFAAAKNQKWQGVINFASGRQVVDPEDLRVCLATGDRIQWRDAGGALRREAQAFSRRATLIRDAIECFLGRQKGPPFWPSFTSRWFLDPTTQPTHDPTPGAIKDIKKYLSQLLPGFDLPDAWFTDPQWKALYNVLKGLIGAFSVSAGHSAVDRKNLRLGALPLLLAAQMRWKGADLNWLRSFEWDAAAAYPIMNHDDAAAARTAIRSAAHFLERLAYSSEGFSQVLCAHWGRVANDEATHLLIDFDLDPLWQAGTKSLLQTLFGERWGNQTGQTIGAYVDMMENARTTNGRVGTPSFSLCIYPVVIDPVVSGDSKKTITRLDFKAL